MQVREKLVRTKERCDEIGSHLLDESNEFYLYGLMPPGESKDRMERWLWESSTNFRAWSALSCLVASYEHLL